MCPPYEPNIDLHDYLRERLWNEHQSQRRNVIKTNHRKAAEKLKGSIKKAADSYGACYLCFLTLTLCGSITPKDANKAFKKATYLLKRLFPRGFVRVLSTQNAQLFHFHIVGIADHDVASNFDWASYDQFLVFSKKQRALNPELRTQLRRLKLSICGNQKLQLLQKELQQKIPQYGFGNRILLTPVRSVEAAAKYMVKNYFKATRALKLRGIGGRAQLIAYHGKFPVVPKQVNEKFRLQLNIVLEALGLTREQMKDEYGSHWCFRLIGYPGVFHEIQIRCGNFENASLETIREIALSVLREPPYRIRNDRGVWEWAVPETSTTENSHNSYYGESVTSDPTSGMGAPPGIG